MEQITLDNINTLDTVIGGGNPALAEKHYEAALEHDQNGFRVGAIEELRRRRISYFINILMVKLGAFGLGGTNVSVGIADSKTGEVSNFKRTTLKDFLNYFKDINELISD